MVRPASLIQDPAPDNIQPVSISDVEVSATKNQGDDDDGNTLDINAENLSQQIDDPVGLVTYIARALQAFSDDQIRVDLENQNSGPLDASGAIVTITEANTLAVEQQTPVQTEDTAGNNVDPGTVTNQSGIVGDTITPDGTGATFASQAVPDGFAVVVQNDPGNADNVAIQDDGGTDRHTLQPGDSFSVQVSNLNEITVTGTANNPSVHATVEAP